jgi:site-specific recombinase XerC
LALFSTAIDTMLQGRDLLVRRTKALHILKGTGDLQAVRALLGHATIEGTSRFLGLESNSDSLEVCRAFDI